MDEDINDLLEKLGPNTSEGKIYSQWVTEFYKQPRTELEKAVFLSNVEKKLEEVVKHVCPECGEPTLNDGRGPFCCGTCRGYRCDRDSCRNTEKPVIEKEGNHVCTSCGM